MRTIDRIAALLLAGIVSAGCSDSLNPLGSDYDVQPSHVSAEIRAAEGLAHTVARALSVPGVRIQVRNAMRDAPSVEHKLHFQDYLASPRGGQLLAHMAVQNGISPQTLLERVRALPELEFYIPEREHRLTWTGSEDLYVYAITVDESEQAPYVNGFDPAGGSRRAYEMADFPADAVFALVPVETDFSEPQLAPITYKGPTVQSPDQCHPMSVLCAESGATSPSGGITIQSHPHETTYLTHFKSYINYDEWRGSMEIEYWIGPQGSNQTCDRFDNVSTNDPMPLNRHATDFLAQSDVPLESDWYEDDDGPCQKSSTDNYIGQLLTSPGDLGKIESIEEHAEALLEQKPHLYTGGGDGCETDCPESIGTS